MKNQIWEPFLKGMKQKTVKGFSTYVIAYLTFENTACMILMRDRIVNNNKDQSQVQNYVSNCIHKISNYKFGVLFLFPFENSN